MSTLMVASAGGHLKELHRLWERLVPHTGNTVWVTTPSAQSRSLLRGEEVVFVRAHGSRSVRGLPHQLQLAHRMLSRGAFCRVLSTGASIAIPFLMAGKAFGVPTHYIECAARVCGPSLTGRILQNAPGTSLYTQHQCWEGHRWQFRGSVYDGFRADTATTAKPIRRVLVTVGSWNGIGFRRLLERLVVVLPPNVEVFWQTGHTDVAGLPVRGRKWVPADMMAWLMRRADAVVAHAGTGAALDALEAGKSPVLVPRLRAHGEHVDDHQDGFGRDLHHRGLAIHRHIEEVGYGDLLRAASRRTVSDTTRPPFLLTEGPTAREGAA